MRWFPRSWTLKNQLIGSLLSKEFRGRTFLCFSHLVRGCIQSRLFVWGVEVEAFSSTSSTEALQIHRFLSIHIPSKFHGGSFRFIVTMRCSHFSKRDLGPFYLVNSKIHSALVICCLIVFVCKSVSQVKLDNNIWADSMPVPFILPKSQRYAFLALGQQARSRGQGFASFFVKSLAGETSFAGQDDGQSWR